MNIFTVLFAQPLYNLLVGIYDVFPIKDIGFAIIFVTIIVKLILWPLTAKSLKSQKDMQEMQPKIDAIKETHKDNKEAMAKAMMELYSREKVNPLSSCLPLLIQMPIIFALYRVFLSGLNGSANYQLYSFIPAPGEINAMFLGLVNLHSPNMILSVIAGALQFIQTKMIQTKRPPKIVSGESGAKDETMLASMNKSMLYFMPVMTVVIGASLPSGLMLYWIVMNAIAVLQQFLLLKKKSAS